MIGSETPCANSVQEGSSESQGKARNPESKQRASSMAAQGRDGARETDQGSTCWEQAPRCSGARAPAHGGDRAWCSGSGRPRDQMFFFCLCWPGRVGPQRVWPQAPQVRRMRSSCRAACRGTGSRPSSLAKAVPWQVAGGEAVPTHTELDGKSEDENQTRCHPSGISTCPGKWLMAGPWWGRRKPPGWELLPRWGSAETPTHMRSWLTGTVVIRVTAALTVNSLRPNMCTPFPVLSLQPSWGFPFHRQGAGGPQWLRDSPPARRNTRCCRRMCHCLERMSEPRACSPPAAAHGRVLPPASSSAWNSLGRNIHPQTHWNRHIQIHRHTNIQTYIDTATQTCTQGHKHSDTHVHRDTERHT